MPTRALPVLLSAQMNRTVPLPVPASYPLTSVIHGSVTMAVHTSPMDADTPNSPAPAFPTTFVPLGSMESSYARWVIYTF